MTAEEESGPEAGLGRGLLGLGILSGSGMVRSAVATGAREVSRRIEELDDARARIAELERQVRVLNFLVGKLVTHTKLPPIGKSSNQKRRGPRPPPPAAAREAGVPPPTHETDLHPTAPQVEPPRPEGP